MGYGRRKGGLEIRGPKNGIPLSLAGLFFFQTTALITKDTGYLGLKDLQEGFMKTILTTTVSVVALDAEQLSVDCVADHSAYTRFFTTARPALRHPTEPWPAPRAPAPRHRLSAGHSYILLLC